MEQKKIDRINELSRISRQRALTEEEQSERSLLRSEYISSVRQNLEAQLSNTVVVNEDGSRHRLQPKTR